MTRSRSSSRRWRRVSSVSARPRSASRLRSWNSSKMHQRRALERGSSCDACAAGCLRSSPRCGSAGRRGYRAACESRPCRRRSRPASRPCARAAARAASRRGSSMTILPPPSQGASSSASGTSVVLPAPGGACSTAAPLASNAARSSGSAAPIGSSACQRSRAKFMRFAMVALSPSRHRENAPGRDRRPALHHAAFLGRRDRLMLTVGDVRGGRHGGRAHVVAHHPDRSSRPWCRHGAGGIRRCRAGARGRRLAQHR